MFETLFTYQTVLARHRDGPLARERASYLEGLTAQGLAHETLLWRARYALCVAREIAGWPADHLFAERDIGEIAIAWAAKRVARGRAESQRWPEELFRFAATDFLRSIGRLASSPPATPGRYHHEIEDFVAIQHEGRWPSEATCRAGRWQVGRFVMHLEQQGIALGDVEPRFLS
jgi:hypothetical protein